MKTFEEPKSFNGVYNGGKTDDFTALVILQQQVRLYTVI